MKALVQDSYGGPDVLELRDVPAPVAGDGEVLVEVRAAAVNAYDWHVMRGDPYIARLLTPKVFGRRGPHATVGGRDFAGLVAAVGRDVTGLRPGDEVYGDLGQRGGAFAEYACVPRGQVTRKPAGLTFEQAAAVPLAGNTAFMGVQEVRSGQRVLVNGASGGVGTFAVQLVKAFGAHVTGVCSTRNVGLVRGLGADEVVDYTSDDFTSARYDVVFDLVGNRTLREFRRALTPGGTLILSGGGISRGGSVVGPMGLMIRAELARAFVKQRLVRLVEVPSAANLNSLRELIEAGRVTPAVDRTYPLTEAAAAIRYVEQGHARAKVVITV